ncbi:MAG: cupin domain-containing protein [Candidatus Sumerlaeia bacterium]|nr:cupin domain-containing protein [Candidatus Sumerlaeia bacterium]
MSSSQAEVFHVASSADVAGANSIVSQALLTNPSVKVVRFVFSKGQELSEHTATVAAMIHQVSGRSRWGLGAEQREAEPGDWAYMPPNLKHSIHASEDAVVLLILLRDTKAS